jgi:KDO2-lipid IV(A) lauroyltransferase
VLSEKGVAEGAPRKRKARREETYGKRDDWRAHLQYWLVRALAATLVLTPDVLRLAFLRMLARLAHRLDRRHTRGAEDFIATALGPDLPIERRDALVRASYLRLATVAVDAILRPRLIPLESVPSHYVAELSEDAERLFERGGPAVLLSGHIGDWEAGGAYMRSRGFEPIHAVAKPPRNRPLSIWMEDLRRQCGINVISRYGAMRDAFSVLAAGESLVLFVDHRATMRPVMAPFFGRLAACERTTGVLLKRSKVPALVAACLCTERRFQYKLVARRVFWPDELAKMTPEEIVVAVNRELEELIHAHPDQPTSSVTVTW